MKLFTWCSFASETEWLGAVILEGHLSAADVLAEASRLGINPGGEVMAMKVPPGLQEELHARLAGRLLSFAECEAEFGLVSTKTTEPELPFECIDQGNPS